MSRLTYVVKNLIIINVLIHIGIMTLPEALAEYPYHGRMYFIHSPFFQPFQIVTSMFLHAGFGHLFMNMLGLFFIGPMVENVLGGKRFLILYLLAGLGGSLLHMGYNYFEYLNLGCTNCQAYYDLMRTGALGASGCVFGVVIAFAMMFPKEKLIIINHIIHNKTQVTGSKLNGFFTGLGTYLKIKYGNKIKGFTMNDDLRMKSKRN